MTAMGGLVCSLTAGEGRETLLSTRLDLIAQQEKEEKAAKIRNSSEIQGEADPMAEEDGRGEDPNNPNVFESGPFYVEVFREMLSKYHYNADQRRLVHGLFGGATFK